MSLGSRKTGHTPALVLQIGQGQDWNSSVRSFFRDVVPLDDDPTLSLTPPQPPPTTTTAPLDRNLPVLMGLLGVWNLSFLGYKARTMLPYSEALCKFPAHVQQVTPEPSPTLPREPFPAHPRQSTLSRGLLRPHSPPFSCPEPYYAQPQP